jgi:carboxyl-terminal processing protease
LQLFKYGAVVKRALTTLALACAAFAGGAAASHLAHARTGAEGPYSVIEQLARVLVIVENEYVDPVERDKLVNGAIKGMVAELDPHSAYLPPDENALFRGETEGKFGGVGLEVEVKDDRVIVVAPIEGSPAARAGVKPGDRIVAVAGESTRGVSLDKLIKKMRGDAGTRIEITVQTPGDDRLRTVSLVREVISVVSVTGKRLADDVGYLRIKQFQGATHEEFLRVIGRVRAASSAPLKAVVVDLRNNPGGLVDQATGVADEMIGAGTVYTTRQRGKIIDEVSATSGGALVELPIVLLVNEYSASASELVAGALQDHKRATVLGATTFGKGSVQSILELPGGAGMKLTTMRYYTPLGRVIQGAGIVPDIAVEQAGVKTPGEQIVRERDLEGYLPADDGMGKRGKPVARPPARDAGADGGPADGGAPEPRAADGGAADGGAREQGAEDGGAAAGGRRETEFGVARVVPDDPTGGPDHVLSVGYQLARTLGARKK